MSEKVTPLRPRRKCPECGHPSERETFPFCSPRCKAVDLNRWLSGAYVIPGPSVGADTMPDDDEDRSRN
ncbi:DNA gyrase inhibitor YacG [Aureimonas jatrophae]|uniref:DNA gyrase inhibitor YacG n=1 Tax=Aureimonas jatrophae TaxID=1166073 RepID=UPI000B88F351|nr:DNA gyrase inhibitor YacG [Aureimonas jatrophae]MBB3949136.1 hypothetical protein [Aureimonas jatrophae]